VAKTSPERLKAQIVLTDGIDTGCSPDYAALIADANAADIQIYTIGLGAGVNTALLQHIADETAGQYFPVDSADDLPEVFRRIAEEPDPTLDTDGDGLPNWLELEGFRRGNGSIITTDPAEFDSDGDGLSDGEEAGARQTGPDGDYYDGITDPTKADTDDDGLSDPDELELIGTDPANTDTDGDSLSDGVEMLAGFEPTDRNPDGDAFGDAEEYARDSNPLYYDLTGWEYAAAVVAGFILGDAGQNMVDSGALRSEHIQCFGSIGGWLASGFFVIGDIRDTLAALVRGDIVDTFLNAIGLIPLLGDGAKIVQVFTKYITWLDNLRGSLARWAVKQFDDVATVAASPDRSGEDLPADATLAAPNPAKAALEAALRALGWTTTQVTEEVKQFARARNNLQRLDNLLKANVRILDTGLPAAEKQNALSRVNDPGKWNLTSNIFTRQEAIAVEGAVEYLQKNNYTVLYVQRNLPVPQLNVAGPGQVINHGPDILATRQVGGVERLVVIETKGGDTKTMIRERRLRSTAGGVQTTQLTHFWLRTNDDVRYLNRLRNAKIRLYGGLRNLLKPLTAKAQHTMGLFLAAGQNLPGARWMIH
jgi:hypothetical protein